MHTELHHVLPIQPGNDDPNAFEVFGLSPIKSEPAAIKLAIEQTIARLKDEKSKIDPQLWKRVVTLVRESKTTLADKDARETLRKELSQKVEQQNPPEEPASHDPLADLLPTANPTAAMPVEKPKDLEQPSAPEPLIPEPVAPAPKAIPADALDGIAIPDQPQRGPSRRKRKKRSLLGPAMLFAASFAMVAILGGLAYFLLAGPNRIAVSGDDGRISISKTNPSEAADREISVGVANETEDEVETPVRDPVMGTLMPDTPPPKIASAMPKPEVNPPKADQTTTVDVPEPMVVEPIEVPPLAEISTEVPEDIVEISESLKKAIQQSQWIQMEQLSKQLPASLPETDTRSKPIMAIGAIGDLASYFRGALIRGMVAQPTASTISLEGRSAIGVVEAKADRMVLRIGGKNVTYPIDEIPFVLVQFLVREEITDAATREASQWIYRYVWPLATESHKREAIERLRMIDPTSVEGVESLVDVADQLDRLLPNQ